jgi:hypothetical protein
VPNVDLRVLDLEGLAAAEFRTDSKGAFVFDFSSLPKGDYDLVTTTKGWRSSIARIVITGPTLRLWRHPLQVKLGFGFECDTGVSRVPLLI